MSNSHRKTRWDRMPDITLIICSINKKIYFISEAICFDFLDFKGVQPQKSMFSLSPLFRLSKIRAERLEYLFPIGSKAYVEANLENGLAI
jgi:hypothetical protein